MNIWIEFARFLSVPEAHQDPYLWVTVLFSHALLGAFLTPLLGWWVSRNELVQNPYGMALKLSVFSYFVLWEIVWQRLGDGYQDAMIDAIAWALGSLLALGLIKGTMKLFGASGLALGVVAAAGIALLSMKGKQ